MQTLIYVWDNILTVENLLTLIVTAGIIAYIWYCKNLKKKNKAKNTQTRIENSIPETTQEIKKEISSTQNNWDRCYEPQYLMTQNEKYQFRKILNWSKGKGLHVFTKVRLADLIKPKGNNQKLFWKIQAKHLDFVICDENIKVKLIVELQDKSHNTPDRKERDEFVKQVLESCGYKIIQVYYVTDEILNNALGFKEPTTEIPVIEQS